MTDVEFRDFLDLLMHSDPWPIRDGDQAALKNLANKEARKRGFADWVAACHAFKPPRDGGDE